MTRPNSRRPMSRAAYQDRVAALKAEHPWLAKQVVEPALATLAVLAHFVGQCELLMKPADYRHLPLFCATNQRTSSACGWNWWAPASTGTGLCWI